MNIHHFAHVEMAIRPIHCTFAVRRLVVENIIDRLALVLSL